MKTLNGTLSVLESLVGLRDSDALSAHNLSKLHQEDIRNIPNIYIRNISN